MMAEFEEELAALVPEEEKRTGLLGLLKKALSKAKPPPEEEEDEEDEKDEAPIRKKCSKCGAMLGKSSSFCGACGTQAMGQTCSCGAVLAKGYAYCPECGEALQKSFVDGVEGHEELAALMDAVDGDAVYRETTQELSGYLERQFAALEKSLGDLSTAMEQRLGKLEKSLGAAGLNEQDRALLKSVADFADLLGQQPRGRVGYQVDSTSRDGDGKVAEGQVWDLLQKGLNRGVIDGEAVFAWETQRFIHPETLKRLQSLS